MKITPCLWFDNEAEEAAKFYVSIFPNSKILKTEKYTVDTPSNKPIGSVMTVEFEINGFKFLGLNGGAYFKPNPSISFHIKCKTKEEVDSIWNKLSKNGKVLMPLDKYLFSERYGWIQDKYGFSWQIILAKDNQKFTPVLMFTKHLAGKAEEAINLYTTIFKDSSINFISKYEKGEEPDKKGTVKYASFILLNQEFGAMDSAHEHHFSFNEAISLMIECKDQEEINYYYNKLSADPKAEVCGWLKDKFGVSWQLIVPGFEKLTRKKEVMEALLKMKRIDINKLEKIYNGMYKSS